MIKTISRYFGLLVLLQGLFLAGMAVSAETAPDFDKQVRSWDRTIEKISNRVQSGRTGSLEERDLRSQLKDITDSAAAQRDAAIKMAKPIKGLLDALGAPPAENGKAEAETIQKRRIELASELSSYEGRTKQVDLIIVKADQVMATISGLSRERLKAALVERTVTPLNPKAWAIAVPEAARLFEASFIETPGKWWPGIRNSSTEQATLLRNLLIAIVAAIIAWFLGRWLRTHYGRVQGIDEPSYARRLLAGLVEGGGRSLGPIIFVLLEGSLVIEGDLIEGQSATVVLALEKNLVLFFLGYALIKAALTPRRLHWRLLDFGDEASRLLVFRLKIILVAFLVFDGIRQAVSWATPSAELASVWTLLFTLTLVPLLISLLGSKIWGTISPDKMAEPEAAVSRLPRLRIFLTLGLIALPVTAALGYSGLAYYVTRAVIMSGLVLGGLGLLRSVGRESLVASLDFDRPFGRGVRDIFVLDQKTTVRVLFWLHILLDLILLVVAGLALLPVWGLGAEETAASATKILRGVKIGSYTFSLMDIMIGLVLFVGVILITRFLQKALERHILPNLTQDKGVRDALKTGVGYIGVVIASLIAISAAGLDLTNLALIAGALSVGVGFGLQNVVNNFVSGLILLAERPIKPGDWVVVGGHEGTVKKVNVRSTEIETFQRASVIIPNADLISTPVINWTHKNLMGRVEITVGVAYGSDPNLVKSVLLDCARPHLNVLSHPEPFVLFKDFGDSSLNFELRAYVANVEKYLHTASEIRFAINDAFKENGIEIPFPQRVLHYASPVPEVPLPESEKV